MSSYSDLEYKAREAVERGALGLILLPDNFNHYRDPGSLPKAELENLGLNVIRLSPTWAERLIEAAGQNVRQVRRSINRDLIPNSFPMRSIQAVVRIDVTVIRKTVRNVVGNSARRKRFCACHRSSLRSPWAGRTPLFGS